MINNNSCEFTFDIQVNITSSLIEEAFEISNYLNNKDIENIYKIQDINNINSFSWKKISRYNIYSDILNTNIKNYELYLNISKRKNAKYIISKYKNLSLIKDNTINIFYPVSNIFKNEYNKNDYLRNLIYVYNYYQKYLLNVNIYSLETKNVFNITEQVSKIFKTDNVVNYHHEKYVINNKISDIIYGNSIYKSYIITLPINKLKIKSYIEKFVLIQINSLLSSNKIKDECLDNIKNKISKQILRYLLGEYQIIYEIPEDEDLEIDKVYNLPIGLKYDNKKIYGRMIGSNEYEIIIKFTDGTYTKLILKPFIKTSFKFN